ncbi:MAG: YggS family pyridoxal phosphate-dependent enzyme [Planctomycetes bacterium]|nr:YggS family pyridoxal phosphate-dependent enzyme [Planctomycetota bacterium]
MKDTLRQNQERLAERIAEVSRAADRSPSDLCVVAITKYVQPETALALASLGQRDLGENRPDSLEAKADAFRAAGEPVRWHFVGHLQRNKARRVVKIADVIHSVDTTQLIRTLDRIASEEDRELQVFLEVRLTEEKTKHGFMQHELQDALAALAQAPRLEPLGVMGMSPAGGTPESAITAFTRLRKLADELEASAESRDLFRGGRVRTSMGMSGDFPQAITAGSDYLRIGSSFFEGLSKEPGEVPA